jgi:hypothetical protein
MMVFLALPACGLADALADEFEEDSSESYDDDFIGVPEYDAPQEDTPYELVMEAMEVYSWFTMEPLDVDLKAPADGRASCYLVLDERYQTFDALNKKALGYFSEKIVSLLWSFDTYTIIDGMLYADAAQGRGIKEEVADVSFEVVSETDNLIVYKATVYYLSDEDEPVRGMFEFTRELISDQWVFTAFPFFW